MLATASRHRDRREASRCFHLPALDACRPWRVSKLTSYFFGDGGTRFSSECCAGVAFLREMSREPGAESVMSPSIDGHAMIAKPITTEKKRSDVFELMLVKRAACIAVVTPHARNSVDVAVPPPFTSPRPQ